MKSPQTKLIKVANNCCLFLCYLRYIGIIPENLINLVKYIEDAQKEKLIDEECTVLDAEKLLKHFSGKSFSVIKKAISSINDIKELSPVRFDFGSNQHWVLVANGEIVFNSLEFSNCVAKGYPTTARIIKLK